MVCRNDDVHSTNPGTATAGSDLVFGRPTGPTLNAPPIGVPILSYTGYDNTPGIWFFSLPLASSVRSVDKRHALLIVPLRSELLLDALAGFQDSAPAIAVWHDKQAREFVEWCITE
ncbi:hypothetical protein [Microbispora sp. NPDC049633]|uniref:hypothetical protein n=1 Tax=Microbispora sp. NPDC049633 TaxID=3154355 RepID=UPI0034312D14